ncbi:unnamed protein product, partial [Symbiodinium microadriaticum]
MASSCEVAQGLQLVRLVGACVPGEALPGTAPILLQWSLRTSTEQNFTLNATDKPANNAARAKQAMPRPNMIAVDWEQTIAGLQRSRGQDVDEDPSMTAAAVASLVTNLVVCLVCLGLFSLLRQRYPLVYAGNAVDGAVALPGSGALAWLLPALQASSQATLSLDGWLAVEYSNLGTKLMAFIGIPMFFIFGALHRYCGHGDLEKTDLLESLSIRNVHGVGWIYYLHGICALCLVLLVRSIVFKAQERYLQRRFAWLKSLPCPRCSTILVEGIPEEYRSEDRVRQFFSATFDARVMQVNMVRHTQLLDQLSSEHLVAKARLRQSERLLERDGSRPTARVRFAGEPVDAISYFLGEMQDKHQLVQQEQSRIRQESASLGGVNSHCAFVTFGTRQDAAIAKTLDFSQDGGHWVITDAPEASTIRWGKLSTEPTLLRTVSGILLITFLYAGFTPICVAISDLAQSLDLGPFQPLWSAFAPTLGLTVFLAMLPTVLLLIFDACFLPRSDTAAQHLLQFWYFAFLLFFVLFLPIIGTNFSDFAHQVYKSPAQVFGLVAARVPEAAEFFFDYVVLMWSVACVDLLRVMILLKFLIFRSLYPEAEAKRMAEPEDQDYCGMGGRMARWNLNLCIGVVFSSVFPLVSLAVLVKFLLHQVTYGYLLVE